MDAPIQPPPPATAPAPTDAPAAPPATAPPADDADDDCPICLDPLVGAGRAGRPRGCPGNHRCHVECLTEWAAINPLCPLCKREFDEVVGDDGAVVPVTPDDEEDEDEDVCACFRRADLPKTRRCDCG